MKITKSIKSVILLLIMLVNIIPINIYAEDVPIGLDIEGEITLSAVTTLNSNVKLDVITQESTTSYIKASNTGNASIDISIINIAPVGVDIPDNFLPYETAEPVVGKNWHELNEVETKEYIAFGVTRNGLDYDSILPNQTIKLGRITEHFDGMIFGDPKYMNDDSSHHISPSRSFGIRIKSGFLWGATTNASYNITTMIELSIDQEELTPPKHANIEHVMAGLNGTFNGSLSVGSYIQAVESFVFDYEKFVYTGSVTNPSNEVVYFNLGLTINDYTETVQEGTKWIDSTMDIPDFVMDEYGTYYIELNFGFRVDDTFVPYDNYSRIISITLAE
jgi:hypothetical protein